MSGVIQASDHKFIIGLGSNISPADNLSSAVYLLGQFAPIKAISDVWQTRPVGSKGPDFLNAAILITTPLSRTELRYQVLRPIENLLGRVRTKDPNAARTIDLDILIIDGDVIDQDLWNYAHISVPVSQLVPGFCNNETGETLAEIADRLINDDSITKVNLELNRIRTTRDIV